MILYKAFTLISFPIDFCCLICLLSNLLSASWLFVCSWTLVLYTHQSSVCWASVEVWLNVFILKTLNLSSSSHIYRSRATTLQCKLQSWGWSCGLSRRIRWGEVHKRLTLSLVVYEVQLLCLQFPLVHSTPQCEGHRLNSMCTLTLPTIFHWVACRAIITTVWMFHWLNTLVWLTLNSIWQARLLSILW